MGLAKGPGLPGCTVSALPRGPHILPSLHAHPMPNTRPHTSTPKKVQTACSQELREVTAGSAGPGKLAHSATVEQTCETGMGLEVARGPSTNSTPVTGRKT